MSYANSGIQSEGCAKIYERIFLPNTTRTIFHKFILPHARLHEGVEYKYSRLEGSRYADLRIHSDTAFNKMQQLMKQGMFGQTMQHSQEGMRRERKDNLDIMFSCLAKL